MADLIPDRLKQLRLARGWSLAKLGEMIGTSGQNVSKLELGKARLTLDWMNKFAQAFGIEPLELMQVAPRSSPPDPRQAGPDRFDIPQYSVDPRDMIPVRSAGRGGNGQSMFLEDGPIEWTPRPNVLKTVRDAYAIYMVGDSMIPRYHPGWLIYVHPFKPPARGRAVAVTLANNEVLVKEWLGQDATHLMLRQYNPAEELRIPLAEVRDVHLIVGSAEE
ncbi:MAG TPA: LexA family transcriptional regulator [Aliidongia sp.]|nr:LexA family transcriptional regulator [Aliidongia sp.]